MLSLLHVVMSSVIQFDKSIHPVVLYLHIHGEKFNLEKEGKSRKIYQSVCVCGGGGGVR